MARLLGAAALLLALAAGACGGDDGSAGQSERTTVVAGFYPVAELARRIGGDRVEVTDLTPPGVEPHDVEISARQVDRVEDADVVLYLGGGFQPGVADAASHRKGPTVDLLEHLNVPPAPSGGDEDPHFWLDPRLMRDAVDIVRKALVTAAPADAEVFRANATAYGAELGALDQEMAKGLASCRRRLIVTAHAAFYGLARRYGLVQLPIAGLSPEAEPDAGRLAVLADTIRENGITTVFYERLVSPKVAETLAREAGVATAVLDPVEGLTRAQLRAGGSYASVMRSNLATLRRVLGCA